MTGAIRAAIRLAAKKKAVDLIHADTPSVPPSRQVRRAITRQAAKRARSRRAKGRAM